MLKNTSFRSILLVAILCVSLPTFAQQRVVAEVKKSIDGLTTTVAGYKAALSKVKPALTHPESCNKAETWYVAGRTCFGLYDKYVDTRRVGAAVNALAMADALVEGYSYMERALQLDTIYQLDKQGNYKLDSKTGQPRYKTKYSADIVSRYRSHLNDFKWAGSEYYNVKRWGDAWQAWDGFLAIARQASVPDSVRGQVRYYQALSDWQQGKLQEAVDQFADARQLGYNAKEAYDYALICLSDLGNDKAIVELARSAYERFGSADAQYIRILINDHIGEQRFAQAALLLDEAIAQNPNEAELYNLKGLVVEQQEGIEAALPLYERSIDLNPDDARSQFNVGRYYFNKATMIEEANPRLSLRALRKKVNPVYEQALPHLERSYELDPSNDDVRNALRTIYYKLGNAAKLEALDGK